MNKRARVHYLDNPSVLTALQVRAADELRQSGICMLDCEQLFSAGSLATYLALGERIVKEPENKNRIAVLRSEANASLVHDRQKYYFI